MPDLRHDIDSDAGREVCQRHRRRQRRRNTNTRECCAPSSIFRCGTNFLFCWRRLGSRWLEFLRFVTFRSTPFPICRTRKSSSTRSGRAGAANRAGPGHISDHDQDVVSAACEGGARLFVLRVFIRLCDFRRWYRSLLGAKSRARIPQWAKRTACLKASRQASARTRPAWDGRSCIRLIPKSAASLN